MTKINFPNFQITSTSIKTNKGEFFFYEIEKIQVNNINSDNP